MTDSAEKIKIEPCNNGWCLNGGTSNAQCKECNQRSETLEGTAINILMRMKAERMEKSWIYGWLLDAALNTPIVPSRVTGDEVDLKALQDAGRFYQSVPQDILHDCLKALEPFESPDRPNSMVDMVQYVCSELTKLQAPPPEADRQRALEALENKDEIKLCGGPKGICFECGETFPQFDENGKLKYCQGA